MGTCATDTLGTADPLATALFGQTRQALLAFFLQHADREFYLRQVVRMVGAGHGAVQRELARLVAVGILTRRADGHQVYYRANPACPVFAELKSLLLKTAGVAGVLREHLRPIADRINVGFVFGSFAAGRETADSDVDVMIIGDVSFAEVVTAFQAAQDALSREINPTVYPPAEFSRKLSAGHHFLDEVLRGPKVFLVGSDDDLERLAKRGLARRPQADSPGNRRSARRGRS